MTTQKQIEANGQNALLSRGAVTEEGKAIVSKNAIKHGIFTQDLIISHGDGKENIEEYQELLNNLIQSLNPNDQMEHLLVEKIAVDYWRLRRVLRFENGTISKYPGISVSEFYKKLNLAGNNSYKTKEEIDVEIAKQKKHLEENSSYIKCLRKGIVTFDKEFWEGEGLERDIEIDLLMVLTKIGDEIVDNEGTYLLKLARGNLAFDYMKRLLAENGYTDNDIKDILIECLGELNQSIQKGIHELEQDKYRNQLVEEVTSKICSLPSGNNAEKVLRYEKSLEKSIFQNLAILKKLQNSE
jgi:hypothetical protein